MYLPAMSENFASNCHEPRIFQKIILASPFSIFIKHANVTRFDSAFASMLRKDIPGTAHKPGIEKTVAGNDNVDLAAGFRHEIENVGFSEFVDTSKAGNLLKII